MSENAHKLAAIVFTDIVGYTKQMEEDEKRVMELLQAQRDIITPIVKSYSGEIIKELGDGLLMMFNSAVEAVRCAVSIQTRLKDEDLTIRAGIHIGEVIFKDGDVFGSAVNAAARIQALATAKGVCISDAVKQQIRNQTDITVHSIGIKALKGIKEPMEIYEVFIEGVTKIKKKGFSYFFNDLWSRRVFHVMAIYILGSWLVRMAVSSYVTSKMLSPYLVDLTWVILISLIPTVILLTYYHGYRSSGKWTRAELIGFPSNAVFSILLIVFLFSGKDLGAATTTVTVEDENGIKSERTVVKNEFLKKSMVFFIENAGADTSLNWLQYAIPNLINYDANEDNFLEVVSATDDIGTFRKLNYQDGLGAPFMIKRKIAGDIHVNTFMTGTFNCSGGNYTVSTQLYDTKTGKPMAEHQYSDQDIFRIIDEITLQLKKDLGIPESHIKETTDLPVSEIYTSSLKALEFFTKGSLEASMNNNWGMAIQLMENAIAEDKDFIFAHRQLIGYCINDNQMDKALEHARITMSNLDKLTERQQFAVKYSYYYLNQEPDKVRTICETWTSLYPRDIDAHVYLFWNYLNGNEKDKAVRECKTVLSIDSERAYWLWMLASLYMESTQYDSAEYYFIQYARKFPTEYKSYQNLGNLYFKMSEFTKARENFEKAASLDFGNIGIMLLLADLDIREGNFASAENAYAEALTSSKTAEDSASVFTNLNTYFAMKGQILESLNYFEKSMDKFARYLSPFASNQQYLFAMDKYVLAGRSDQGLKLLKTLENKFQPPFDKIISLGYLTFYIERDDANEADKYLTELMNLINSLGQESLLIHADYARGQIAEIRKDYKTALENYIKVNQRMPGEYDPYVWVARCQRELGNYKEAKKSIDQALKMHPYDPKNNYEAAMVYLHLDDKQKAKEYLDRALEVWKDADTNYPPYQQALSAKNNLMTTQ